MDSKGRSKDPHDHLSEKEKADHSVIVAGPEAHAREKAGASPDGTKPARRDETGKNQRPERK